MRFAVSLVVAGLALAGCRAREAPASAAEVVQARQRRGLESLAAAASRGPLLPFESVLVVVHERLVRELIAAAAPYERVVGDTYRIRVTNAVVRFEDGLALVRLEGRASLAGRPEAAAFAEVAVLGTLDIVELDPDSGLLRGRITVIGVEAHRVAVLGVDAPADAERLVEQLGREQLAAFAVLVSALEIPVRLERSVQLPEVATGGVRIAAASIPLEAAVTDVKAFRGRLWVSIRAAVQPGAAP